MIKNWLKEVKEQGITFFYANDKAENKPSSTLFYAYVTFWLGVVSVISLHFEEKLFTATLTTLMFWVVAVIFYRLRKLDKIKVDLDDRSVELEGKDESKDS